MTRSVGTMISRAARRHGAMRAICIQFLALALACLIFPSAKLAAQQKPTEYSVKAVYLYNFGKFVQWPATASSELKANSFEICILGQDPFGSALDTVVKGEKIDGQPLMTRKLESVDAAENCRIVFISSSEKDRLGAVLQALRSKPSLTVSDLPDFCNRGGMIQFVLEGDKVRFLVNLAPAEKARLTFSSQLLKVATAVLKTP